MMVFNPSDNFIRMLVEKLFRRCLGLFGAVFNDIFRPGRKRQDETAFNDQQTGLSEDMVVVCLGSYQEYLKLLEAENELIQKIAEKEFALTQFTEQTGIRGFCIICGHTVDFQVDFQYSFFDKKIRIPNWRERMICPDCGMNGRTRAIYHFLLAKVKPPRNSLIYITEQVTPLFNRLRKYYPKLTGSEFLDGTAPSPGNRRTKIRNEDLTKLTFRDESFHYILSFDCLEHIPDYRKAIREIFRCLKENGIFYFCVPFYPYQQFNTTRAYINDDQQIVHLEPPEYHGNPLSENGSLCYNNFSFQLLDEIRETGFRDVEVVLYWSEKYGYLGGFRALFVATK